jgi:hypothetical protein
VCFAISFRMLDIFRIVEVGSLSALIDAAEKAIYRYIDDQAVRDRIDRCLFKNSPAGPHRNFSNLTP